MIDRGSTGCSSRTAASAPSPALQLSNFFLESEIDQLRRMRHIVPVVFLAVAAFLLNVVLTRLVAVQREQIAALKALGYANWRSGWHYVKWALAIALIGAMPRHRRRRLMGRGDDRDLHEFFHFPILALPAAGVVWWCAGAVGVVAATLGGLRRCGRP